MLAPSKGQPLFLFFFLLRVLSKPNPDLNRRNSLYSPQVIVALEERAGGAKRSAVGMAAAPDVVRLQREATRGLVSKIHCHKSKIAKIRRTAT